MFLVVKRSRDICSVQVYSVACHGRFKLFVLVFMSLVMVAFNSSYLVVCVAFESYTDSNSIAPSIVESWYLKPF